MVVASASAWRRPRSSRAGSRRRRAADRRRWPRSARDGRRSARTAPPFLTRARCHARRDRSGGTRHVARVRRAGTAGRATSTSRRPPARGRRRTRLGPAPAAPRSTSRCRGPATRTRPVSAQAPSRTRWRSMPIGTPSQRRWASRWPRAANITMARASVAPARLCSTPRLADRDLDEREHAAERDQSVVGRGAAEDGPHDQDRGADEPEEHGVRSASEEAAALLAVGGRVRRELLDAVDVHRREAQVAAAAGPAYESCDGDAPGPLPQLVVLGEEVGDRPFAPARPARRAPARARRRSPPPPPRSAPGARRPARRARHERPRRWRAARRGARAAPSPRAPGPRAGRSGASAMRSRPAATGARGGCRSCRCRASCRAGWPVR